MIEIIFSELAICYYIFGVFSGYHQKLGKNVTDDSDYDIVVYNLYGNIGTIFGFLFLAFYSYITEFWSVFVLFGINILLFGIVDLTIQKINPYPEVIRVKIAYLGKYIVPLIFAIMLFLIFK